MDRAEIIGINIFKEWVGNKGEITNTSRVGVGYDFEVKWLDTGLVEKYEVKGTTKILKIPDMSIVEFDDNQSLKADYLFVVGNVLDIGNEVLYKIPRNALSPENLKLKQTYHIRLFQNRNKMGSYKIEKGI